MAIAADHALADEQPRKAAQSAPCSVSQMLIHHAAGPVVVIHPSEAP